MMQVPNNYLKESVNTVKRTAGILLSISSLPSKYGIGCFSKSAYEFADWLKEAGQSYWQILPLGPTSYGDSPYQSFSTYARNVKSWKQSLKRGRSITKNCMRAGIPFYEKRMNAAISAKTRIISSSLQKMNGGFQTMLSLWQ